MHISLCICGQMALSVLDCELVSIWLFVYPSVTCNISNTTHWILIKRDRMMHVSALIWQFHNCIVCWKGGRAPHYYFVPGLRAVTVKIPCPILSNLLEITLWHFQIYMDWACPRLTSKEHNRIYNSKLFFALQQSFQTKSCPGFTWHIPRYLTQNWIYPNCFLSHHHFFNMSCGPVWSSLPSHPSCTVTLEHGSTYTCMHVSSHIP